MCTADKAKSFSVIGAVTMLQNSIKSILFLLRFLRTYKL